MKFPDYPFKINQGDNIEVRKWLKANGCTWLDGKDITTHSLHDCYLRIDNNCKVQWNTKAWYKNSDLPLITFPNNFKYEEDSMLISMNKRYETTDGCKVRIIATDRNDPNYPVITLITCKDTGEESVHSYTKEGKRIIQHNTVFDLVEVKPWYENIPKQGVLCWVNRDHTIVVRITGYDPSDSSFRSSNGTYVAYAKPLTKAEALELTLK